MKRLAIVALMVSLAGCGGSDGGSGSEVKDLISSTNAVDGKIVRPSDADLPLVIKVESESADIDKILLSLERIEQVAGYQIIRFSNGTEQADITIKSSNVGCLTSIPLGNWQYTIEVGDMASCPNVTFDLVAYKIFGLNRTDKDTYRVLKSQSALADSALATIYNNPPNTSVSDLSVINK
nr:hypothetical protein [uncultured Shewanella sp.]